MNNSKKPFSIWKKGVWEDGTWQNGIWIDGVWDGGIWKKGTWKTGWIYDPNKVGNFQEDWEWMDDYVRSSISPRDYFGEIND